MLTPNEVRFGGHFLPYDVGNFEFSSQLGLRESDQEQGIYNLNQNVLNAGPTPAEQALIEGWYANQPGPSKVLDKTYKTYIDPSWPTQNSVAYNFYQDAGHLGSAAFVRLGAKLYLDILCIDDML